MEERNMLVEELDHIILKYRDDYLILDKNHNVITKVLENTEELLQKRTEDLEFYQKQSEERWKEINKLKDDLTEAYGVITKLEEARIVLNRLMGPGGVITEFERSKYLSQFEN